ncbi:MAG: bifunctional pyr operon transcriptional regulator/uracil phosphoribosyltransferase PyrR [Proteobacteria bacterium]|nr:bifunctional pyr operon transcriptional regulator/uracil phosphoribosyltransferase PyrR [Pseudomonadota bacterium]
MSRTILDSKSVSRCLRRMASEIVDACEAPIALVGIRKGGVPLAAALADLIEEAEGERPAVGAIDITLYRDDLYSGLETPSFGATELPHDLERHGIVLVDDVLYTGRTVRAALGEVHDYGRPRWVKLAVLVDRGWRELPIQADFVGRTIESQRTDKVIVTTDSVELKSGAGS